MRRLALLLALVSILSAASLACSDDETASTSDADEATTETTATTAAPLRWSATITGEHEVSAGYRQGLASFDDGWVFSTNNAFARTDDAFQETEVVTHIISDELTALGYDHVGDIDITDDVLWAPVEQGDYDRGEQVMARYDPRTFELLDWEVVPQHHASFVAVDGDTVYSTSWFTDDTVVRYRWTGTELEPLEPLAMSREIDRIQGGDVADGALWLSTDDERDAVYRVDLATGEVQDLGSMGHVEQEGEGLDATGLPSGLLHALSASLVLGPGLVVDLDATSQPA